MATKRTAAKTASAGEGKKRRETERTDEEASLRDIGRRLKAARENLGLTQREVETAAGLGKGKYAQYEQGKAGYPRRSRRKILANVLGVTSSELFDEPQDQETVDRLALVEQKVDALIAISRLGDRVDALLWEIQRQNLRPEDERLTLEEIFERAPELAPTRASPSRRRRKEK